GPEVAFLYHPALGPLYSIIEKKIASCWFSQGAELILDLADAFLRHVRLQGSLRIRAEQPLGHYDEHGILQYSDRIGSCVLENVEVINQGVDWSLSSSFWK